MSTTPRADDWAGFEPTIPAHFTTHEDELNPDHQGFIGFIPPKDGPMTPIEKSARRLAAELVLMPRKMRPKSEYTEEYLRTTAGCRAWPRLRCAYCNCWKSEDPL